MIIPFITGYPRATVRLLNRTPGEGTPMGDDEGRIFFGLTPERWAQAVATTVTAVEHMPAEFREEIESLIGAGWTWHAGRLTHPDDGEVWIHFDIFTYEKTPSLKRASQIDEMAGRGWWSYGQ